MSVAIRDIPQRLGFLAGLGFASWPVQVVVETLAGIGYAAVSWPLERFDPGQSTAEDRFRLIDATRRANLPVAEWVVQIDFIHLDSAVRAARLRQAMEAIRAAADLDPGSPCNLFTGPAPWNPDAPHLGRDVAEGRAWEMVFAALDTLLPLAESRGIRLALEPVFGHLVHDYYTSLELLNAYPSPFLNVNYDPSHGVLYGNDPGWVIRKYGSRIAHVHLKDVVGRPGGLPGETFLFPLIGEGAVPWAVVSAALNDIGYSGYLTVEFESFAYYEQILGSDPGSAARLSFELAQKLFTPHNH